MCANYVPVTQASRLMQFFGIASMVDAPDADAFPMGQALSIRRAPPDIRQTLTRLKLRRRTL